MPVKNAHKGLHYTKNLKKNVPVLSLGGKKYLSPFLFPEFLVEVVDGAEMA